MSRRPPRRGRHSQATKRGQAGSVSTVDSAGRGHGASSAVGRGAHLSFFSAAGHVVEPEYAEELVDWITKPILILCHPGSDCQSSLFHRLLVHSTPSVGPPSRTEESPELFDHSVGYMLLENAQPFEGSDVGSQVEEGSNVSLERGGVPSTCSQSASSTPPSDFSRQISLPQLLNRKKKFSTSHPHAQSLNASLAKLLALQLLPFQLVDSAPFREFVEC
ncbi:hypothetical protein AB205_0067120, partial [Aquarana catesbeiana]